MPANALRPSLAEEKVLRARGYELIAGVDEVGRGSLAGPVVAAAAIMPPCPRGRWVSAVRDSKMLSPLGREALFQQIQGAAIAVGFGAVSHRLIDARGIASASRLAMKLAVGRLTPAPDYLLIDFFRLPEVAVPQKGVVDGDSLCFSIACASILAKVFRDRMMARLDRVYAGYRFAENKGYCTGEHIACLYRLGPSPVHRRSFRPVRQFI